MGSFVQFLCRNVVSFINGFLFLVAQYLFRQYIVSMFVFRFRDCVTEKNEEESSLVEEKTLSLSEIVAEEEVAESVAFDCEIQDEKQEQNLRFKFPDYEDFIRIYGETNDSIDSASRKSLIGMFIDDFDASPAMEQGTETVSNEVNQVFGNVNDETTLIADNSENEEQTFEDDDNSQTNLEESDSDSTTINTSSDSYTDNDDFSVESTDNLEETDATRQDLESQEMSESSLSEHQDLIDQLKMEVRVMVLPTILEESESPKILDDLKPLKLDKKFHRQDLTAELHRIYAIYRERMRKFDILNYQTIYSTGLMHVKESIQPILKKKSSTNIILRPLISQNQWLSKEENNRMNPDFEVVYVGQMCISWEILHWQYEKVLDLWDADHRRIFRYNEVAGEFQQFQVLIQRFIENEPFQGPRIQNYTKTRCVLRDLLQVPVVRVDKRRDKKWKVLKRDEDELVFTIDLLVEIVQESIRIFWQFLKADRDSKIGSHKKLPEFSDPDDVKLWQLVQKNLQKKERKLKEMSRNENSFLKRFRQSKEQEEDDWDQVLSFFCEVDMKLVSRVLKMTKIIRDQLIWCHKKLENISFVDRRICIEPSFMLFPH